jgi:hypothetical protein
VGEKWAALASQARKRNGDGEKWATVAWLPTKPGAGVFIYKREGYETSILQAEGKLKGGM